MSLIDVAAGVPGAAQLVYDTVVSLLGGRAIEWREKWMILN